MKANWILIALIAAYSDINGQFFVFDDGVFSRLEYQTVQSYKAGFNQLGYIDNMGKLKWYMEGKKVIIEDYAISNYFVTDHLIAYTLGDQLVVVDAGERKTLKYNKGAFMVGDSLISFYDSQNNFLKTYYNGKVYEIEDGLGGLPFKSMLSSDNLMAYVDRNDYLKMFYRGGVHDLSYNIASYRVGKNTIAYVEGSSAEFKIEYKGEHFDVALLPPRSYKVADNLVAFVDDSESFMVFYDGEIYEISSFPPDFYKLGENMLVYSEDGFFKVFYEGHTYSLVNYIPSNYYLNNNTVAYLGQQNQLELFYKGDQLTMSYEPLLRIETFPHCIAITKHPHSTSIFYNGKEYVRE
jgi:hypothetical protein